MRSTDRLRSIRRCPGRPTLISWKAISASHPGQSGEARIFLIQDDNLTAEVPLRRSILQSTLRQKYRSTGRHNPQRDGGPEKGLYRLHPIALDRLDGMIDEITIRRHYDLLRPSLDERGQRLFAASQVRALGYGGLAAVAR